MISQECLLQSSFNGAVSNGQRIALVSLRFRPAFVSIMKAFAKACVALGHEVEYVVDPAYTRFADLSAVAPVRIYNDSVSLGHYSHCIVMNVAPGHDKLASRLKLSGARVVYLYHEPRNSLVETLKPDGFLREVKTGLAYFFSVRMLKEADAVIVPSSYGMRVYEQRDIRYNQARHRIPLLFDDESLSLPSQERRYFSYIGAICRSHAFDRFLDFVKYCLENELPIEFLIASADAMPQDALRSRVLSDKTQRIKIQSGRSLQSEEINSYFAQSVCVWNLYRRCTQSGVLPKCFMFGTPVLATDTGAFSEFVKDGFNGKFVAAEEPAAIYSAYLEITNCFQTYSRNARDTFLSTFYYVSQLERLQQVL